MNESEKPVDPKDLTEAETDYVNPDKLEDGGLNIRPEYKTPPRTENPNAESLAG